LRSNDPRPKCGGEKPRKGRSPTAVFRRPSRLPAAKQIQSCYTPLPIFLLPVSSSFPMPFIFLLLCPEYFFLKYFPRMFFKISFSLVPENILENFYVLYIHARQPGFTQK
jgi:hypothetical protein